MHQKKKLNKKSICFVNKFSFIGGSGTFLHNLNYFLKKKNFLINYFDSKKKSDFIFITGSSFRNVIWIILMKLSGSRIITRVDGKNWIYKYSYLNLKFFISSILKNFSIFVSEFVLI